GEQQREEHQGQCPAGVELAARAEVDRGGGGGADEAAVEDDVGEQQDHLVAQQQSHHGAALVFALGGQVGGVLGGPSVQHHGAQSAQGVEEFPGEAAGLGAVVGGGAPEQVLEAADED